MELNTEIIEVIEATEKALGISAEQIAEELSFPVALMKEAKRGIFPYPLFKGVFMHALWHLCAEKQLNHVDDMLNKIEKADRKAMGVTGMLKRKNGQWIAMPLPETEKSGD